MTFLKTTPITSVPPTHSPRARLRNQSFHSVLTDNMTRAPLSGKHFLNCADIHPLLRIRFKDALLL
ncbi:hypothetical protein J6590_053259 [Homalodisca vitripennis]|nr:hypothetical protein J6590_053259 [Homalodisca vitripennis]